MNVEHLSKGLTGIVLGGLLLGLAYWTTDETGFYPALYALGGVSVIAGIYWTIRSFF